MVRTVKKPEERKQEIIQAARFLFQTRDYEQTTMQDVIDHLGIAKGTIYYYFTSKEALLEAVVEDMNNEALGRMETALESAQGNALEKMIAILRSGNISQGNERILEAMHRPGNISLHVRLLAVALEKQAPLYARILQQGNEEQLFHVKHPLECAEFILSAIQFLTDDGIHPWGEATMTRRVMAIPGLLENLLQARPGSFDFILTLFAE